MRYVSAYLLAVMGGTESPQVADLRRIMESVGIECEEDRALRVIGALQGKNVQELIEQGQERLAFITSPSAPTQTVVDAKVTQEQDNDANSDKSPDTDTDSGDEIFPNLFD